MFPQSSLSQANRNNPSQGEPPFLCDALYRFTMMTSPKKIRWIVIGLIFLSCMGCTEGAIRVGPPGILNPNIAADDHSRDQFDQQTGQQGSGHVSSQQGDTVDSSTSRILAWSALSSQLLLVLIILAVLGYSAYSVARRIRYGNERLKQLNGGGGKPSPEK
jgi:hypothetical protein